MNLSKNLTNLAKDDLSKLLKKMIVSNKTILQGREIVVEAYENLKIVEANLNESDVVYDNISQYAQTFYLNNRAQDIFVI